VSSKDETPWIKAAASQGQGQCVEMRRRGNMIEVRDSKDPDGAVLRYTPTEWAAWIDGAKHGEFDKLV
jgi:hypothetical protein